MASNLTSPMSLTKYKFDLKNPRKNLQIVEDNFFKWSNDHMYRTSTHDMQDKVTKWLLSYLVPLSLKKKPKIYVLTLCICRLHLRERTMLSQAIKVSFQDFKIRPSSDRDTPRGQERLSRRKKLMRSIKHSHQLGKWPLFWWVFSFNARRIPQQDVTLHAFSRRYGKETLMDTSPNYKHGELTTNFRTTI